MSVSLNDIINNYKGDDETVNKLGLDVENVLDLDRNLNRKFEFLHCGECGGPLLGHRAEKCRQRNGVRYKDIVIKGFEDKLKAIDGFRKMLKKHIEVEQEKESKKRAQDIAETIRAVNGGKTMDIAETVKAVIESMESKGKNTKQLVKPRFLPIWS